MSGLFRRITRSRAASPPPGPDEGLAPAEPADAPGDGARRLVDARAMPAGLELDELLGERPTSARRAKLRHRLRHLQRVRDVLLRDLGGLVYEIRRSGAGEREALIAEKTERLARLDAERRDLEEQLDVPPAPAVLRQPGLGGTCPVCGELYGSEARFCSHCGTQLAGTKEPAPSAEEPAAEDPPADGDAPTERLWPGAPTADPETTSEPARR